MIGLLSSPNNPFLWFYANSLSLYAHSPNVCLLLDSKTMSSRDIEIVHRRTQSFFVRKKVNKEHSDKLFGYRLNEFNVAHTYDEMSKFVASRSCSVLINIGTPRKLSSQFIDLFDDGVINIHPGYLPLYR